MKKGEIAILFLFFLTLASLLLLGLSQFVLVHWKQTFYNEASTEAFEIAEAGIEYYRWHLSHDPTDFQDGTGSPGPYIHDYKDPEGNVIGKFSLEIIPPSGCDPTVKIISTGWTLKKPQIKRKIKARYTRKSLASFSFLTNEDVWFGENESLSGPFHSNGGIRMDGSQNSLSSSAKETYICRWYHGCSFSNCSSPCSWTAQGCECPGVWGKGEGGNEGLWKFPVPIVDFDLITYEISLLKQKAQDSGYYFPTPAGQTKGYLLSFKEDGTFDLYRIKTLYPPVYGCDPDGKCAWESWDIKDKEFIDNLPLPQDCSPIFAETNLWIEGKVNGRVTVVAAKLPEPGEVNQANIIINGNIDYANDNSVLAMIAQKNVLVPLRSPDNLYIKGVMVAQNGRVVRYYYPPSDSEPYKTYAIRNYIETYGAIITKKVWTFTWVNSSGNVVSGYQTTNMMYDTNLDSFPPPYFPTYGEYKILSWEEIP